MTQSTQDLLTKQLSQAIHLDGFSTTSRLRTTSVLVVEDHHLSRECLSIALGEYLQLHISGTASDGEEAITRVQQEVPDVVLMDILMPGMDGLQATAFLKEHYPSLKIIMLSCLESRAMLARALSLGANGYCSREASIDTLVEAIDCVTKEGLFLDETMQKRAEQLKEQGFMLPTISNQRPNIFN